MPGAPRPAAAPREWRAPRSLRCSRQCPWRSTSTATSHRCRRASSRAAFGNMPGRGTLRALPRRNPHSVADLGELRSPDQLAGDVLDQLARRDDGDPDAEDRPAVNPQDRLVARVLVGGLPDLEEPTVHRRWNLSLEAQPQPLSPPDRQDP